MLAHLWRILIRFWADITNKAYRIDQQAKARKHVVGVGCDVHKRTDIIRTGCAAKPHAVGDPLAAVFKSGPRRLQCRCVLLKVRVFPSL